MPWSIGGGIVSAFFLFLLFSATPDAGLNLKDEDELVAAARTGDAKARLRIAELLQRPDGGRFIPSLSLPTLLSTTEDSWAMPLLRRVATNEETGLGSLALVSWWRLNHERDDGLLRQILREQGDRSRIKETAMELLLRANDPWAIDERRRLWREACGPEYVGLVWKRPTVVDAALIGPFVYSAKEVLVVEHVCPGSRAEASGFLAGDRIERVGNARCDSYRQCIELVEGSRDGTSDIQVAPAGANAKVVVRRFQKRR